IQRSSAPLSQVCPSGFPGCCRTHYSAKLTGRNRHLQRNQPESAQPFSQPAKVSFALPSKFGMTPRKDRTIPAASTALSKSVSKNGAAANAKDSPSDNPVTRANQGTPPA